MLKAAIIDLDGVILDYAPLRAKAVISVMSKHKLDLSVDFCLNFSDSTDLHMIEAIKKIYRLPYPEAQLLSEYNRALKKEISDKGYPVTPFVIDFLFDLYRNDVMLAVVSSCPSDNIIAMIDSLKLRPYLTSYLSAMDVPNPKPAPDIYTKIAKQMNVEPSECIVIDDTGIGVTAAKNAGMAVIGFLNTHSGKQNFEKVDFVIEGFEEVKYKFVHQVYQRFNGEAVTIAITERLVIRELTVSDIKKMYEIYQSPEVKEYIDDTDDYLNNEIEKHKAYIKNVYSFYGYGYWGVFDKSSGKLMGRCGIQNNLIDNIPEIELGYLLDHKYWGKGYAQEAAYCVLDYAFNELNIMRIVAVIDKLNIRSQKLATTLGMTVERNTIKNSRDCELFVITKETFVSQNK